MLDELWGHQPNPMPQLVKHACPNGAPFCWLRLQPGRMAVQKGIQGLAPPQYKVAHLGRPMFLKTCFANVQAQCFCVAAVKSSSWPGAARRYIFTCGAGPALTMLMPLTVSRATFLQSSPCASLTIGVL